MSSEPASKEQQKQSAGKDAEKDDVHSANNWEAVDMGDADRKQKFLRLMGATKKTHQGTFVIGENQPKQEATGSRAKEVDEELEQQFAESLEHKLSGGARSHLGLGFHDEEKEAIACLGDVPKDNLTSEQTQDEKDREMRKERKDSEGAKRDRSRSPVREAADSTEPDSPSKSKYTMAFVKPSS